MTDLLELWLYPEVEEVYMLAGWRQWADAGNISSGLMQYVIDQAGASRIGVIKPEFYMFQVPGTHHFVRPDVTVENGLIKSHQTHSNEFYYCRFDNKGVVIFLGDEPHLHVERYADVWLDAAEALHVRRILSFGGVYGAMPYDREREIHAIYSVPRLEAELKDYALKFSNYEGGSTIGAYLTYRAGQRGVEMVDLYGFVPAYDFSQLANSVHGLRIDNDFQAWHDLLRRVNHMLGLNLDLRELEVSSLELASSMEAKIEQLSRQYPQLKINDFMQRLTDSFEEQPFMPLDDLWARELGDLLDDLG